MFVRIKRDSFHLRVEMHQLEKRINSLEEELRTSFNTLKSELDNLGKVPDKIPKLVKESTKPNSQSKSF